jgi:hypothetical protein
MPRDQKEYQHQYYLRNKEVATARSRLHYEEHKNDAAYCQGTPEYQARIVAAQENRRAAQQAKEKRREDKLARKNNPEVIEARKQRKRERDKKRREANKEAERARKQQYYLDNRDRVLTKSTLRAVEKKDQIQEYHKEYYRENKDALLVQAKEYRKNNPEVVQARSRKYREEHREEINAYTRQYYAEHTTEIRDKQRKQCAGNEYFKAMVLAGAAVCKAVKAGALPLPVRCLVCTTQDRLQCHHFSYDQDHWCHVIPLCRSCHRTLHAGRVFPEVQTRIAEFEFDLQMLLLNNPENSNQIVAAAKRRRKIDTRYLKFGLAVPGETMVDKAHTAYASAIKRGEMRRPTHCCVCPKTKKIHAHHFSYEQDYWLCCVPLCSEHHRRVHWSESFPEVEAKIAQFLEDARFLDLNNPQGDVGVEI